MGENHQKKLVSRKKVIKFLDIFKKCCEIKRSRAGILSKEWTNEFIIYSERLHWVLKVIDASVFS
jgi:hypothetical protein